MNLTVDEQKYLLERKQEILREIRNIELGHLTPCYYEMNERRVDLLDELNRIEAELQLSHVE